MKCDKCGMDAQPEETHAHAGKTLCEDCFLDVNTVPKTCDPWAVHRARNNPAYREGLNATHEKILSFIRNGKRAVKMEEILKALSLDETDFQRHFSTLRHLELVRAFKDGDEIRYALFKE